MKKFIKFYIILLILLTIIPKLVYAKEENNYIIDFSKIKYITDFNYKDDYAFIILKDNDFITIEEENNYKYYCNNSEDLFHINETIIELDKENEKLKYKLTNEDKNKYNGLFSNYENIEILLNKYDFENDKEIVIDLSSFDSYRENSIYALEVILNFLNDYNILIKEYESDELLFKSKTSKLLLTITDNDLIISKKANKKDNIEYTLTEEDILNLNKYYDNNKKELKKIIVKITDNEIIEEDNPNTKYNIIIISFIILILISTSIVFLKIKLN